MKQAVIITVLGMGVVMVVLTLIMAMITIMRVIIEKVSLAFENTNKSVAATPKAEDESNDIIAAVIVAAVSMYLDQAATQRASAFNKKMPIAPPEPATWLTALSSRRASLLK